ncbi:MAG: hypothetical protein ABFD50_01845, partial [Smithella sp.]
PAVYSMAAELEELVPQMKNPLGAFIGLTFSVKYIYRTAQKPLLKANPLKTGRSIAAPETTCIFEL